MQVITVSAPGKAQEEKFNNSSCVSGSSTGSGLPILPPPLPTHSILFHMFCQINNVFHCKSNHITPVLKRLQQLLIQFKSLARIPVFQGSMPFAVKLYISSAFSHLTCLGQGDV